ncbi:hypothetical protein FDI11_gp19 [Mycobacterium phage Tiger]|uniref:Uncharacterized protein n=3 Tax=Benedictvirus TaxID=2946819 RepID=H9NCY5_9CAUD|nr:hypothetical protein X816_gp17 [Mycobacterium phage Jovo]YP_009607716.1 hypothetical protein FDI11_gp19 [Mycobacterium phage Tiger]ATW60047.1 hypothetical protein SEA_PHLORENCE_73 [Mycobacterium phage Phlorence]ATW61020.1 hypothetical protein SEA_ARAGOG_74 [Mycobacterium phage Aragog]ATW61262.1 hypothetical protein SEA_AGENTM_74 [Mycobacterium phage AgentM]QGJ97270.1 hypothetical protein SEA_LEV2_75 [Mycobacterium phage Lev2]WNM67886.1 hypothetical protein SEA_DISCOKNOWIUM_72 [Mycobacteriu
MIEIYVNGGTSEEIATMLHEVADDIKRGYIPTDKLFRTKLWGRYQPIGTIRTIPESAFD